MPPSPPAPAPTGSFRTGLAEAPYHILRGLCMGCADIIPGVSGGTMAFILGIYPRFMRALRAFDWSFVRLVFTGRIARAVQHTDLALLVPLAFGIVLALIIFSRVVPLPLLLERYPELVYGFFFGLILTSIALLLRETGRLDAAGLGLWAIGTGIGLALANIVPVDTPESAAFLYLCGAIAITAMLLPGVSGAYILLVLHKYAYVVDALGRFDLGVIVPFVLGAATGIILFSRLISWTLARFYRRTMMAITGVLTGSLWTVWPFQERIFATVREKARLIGAAPTWPDSLDATVLGTIALALAGAAIVLWIDARARRRASVAPNRPDARHPSRTGASI